MADQTDTQIFAKQSGAASNGDSKFFGISIRAWVVLLFVMALVVPYVLSCIAVMIDALRTGNWDKLGSTIATPEPLATLTGVAVGYYFRGGTTQTTIK